MSESTLPQRAERRCGARWWSPALGTECEVPANTGTNPRPYKNLRLPVKAGGGKLGRPTSVVVC